MRSSPCLLALLTVILILPMGCTSDQPVKKEFSLSDTVAPVNPNGDSELAKLMREMADYMVRTKKHILSGDSLPAFPDNFTQIHTAIATPGMVDENTMRLMGSSYLASLKNLYACKNEEQTDYYNAAVNACLTCHQSVCPGPIKRIGKLAIP